MAVDAFCVPRSSRSQEPGEVPSPDLPFCFVFCSAPTVARAACGSQDTMQAAACPTCHNQDWSLETQVTCLLLILESAAIGTMLLCYVPPWALGMGA